MKRAESCPPAPAGGAEPADSEARRRAGPQRPVGSGGAGEGRREGDVVNVMMILAEAGVAAPEMFPVQAEMEILAE